ncbi:MAG: hypothetical protein ACFFCG_12015, partial [Promethearchaeota archaeon]
DKFVTNIPTNGDYKFKVFRPTYISTNGMVKLYKLDYTALESSFQILNPEVFNSGYATLKLKNTGTKNLTINDVKINGQSYDFSLGKGINSNQVNTGEDDLVWVDYKSSGKSFQTNDVVNIEVEAQSEALDAQIFTFTNYTSNLFVKEAIKGDIKINKPNSQVVQIDETLSEIYLEIENTGLTTVILKNFYFDSENNTLDEFTYLSGSSILEAGQKAYVKIINTNASFYPIRTEHKIGVITPNNITDEILFTSNYDGFKISILEDSRIASPEALITLKSDFRKHIPINLENTYAYTYDNGTTILYIHLKNTGNIILGLDSIYLKKSGAWTSVLDIDSFNLNPGNERSVTVVVPDEVGDIQVNDELGVIVTTNFDGETKASDIGFVHTIVDRPDIQIIDNVDGQMASYISANETGKILVKNTGDESITLDKLYLNTTTELNFASDMNFEYGDISLDVQECALVSFNITGLQLNSSNILNVEITTNSTAQFDMDFTVIVNSQFYNVKIDDSGTTASNTGNVVITIENNGTFNVTIDSVYVNNTFIALSNFVETIYEIGRNSSIQLTIAMTNLESIIGAVDVGETLEILVRTKEGAEDIHEETVTS